MKGSTTTVSFSAGIVEKLLYNGFLLKKTTVCTLYTTRKSESDNGFNFKSIVFVTFT